MENGNFVDEHVKGGKISKGGKILASLIIISLAVYWLSFSSASILYRTEGVTLDNENVKISFTKPTGFNSIHNWGTNSYNLDAAGCSKLANFNPGARPGVMHIDIHPQKEISSLKNFYDTVDYTSYYKYEGRKKIGENELLVFTGKQPQPNGKSIKMYLFFGVSNIVSVDFTAHDCGNSVDEYEEDIETIISSLTFEENPHKINQEKIDYIFNSDGKNIFPQELAPMIEDFEINFSRYKIINTNTYNFSSLDGNGYVNSMEWPIILPKINGQNGELLKPIDYAEAIFKPFWSFKFKLKKNDNLKDGRFIIGVKYERETWNHKYYEGSKILYTVEFDKIKDNGYYGELFIDRRFENQQITLYFSLDRFEKNHGIIFTPVKIAAIE